jgi:hypothetical protein
MILQVYPDNIQNIDTPNIIKIMPKTMLENEFNNIIKVDNPLDIVIEDICKTSILVEFGITIADRITSHSPNTTPKEASRYNTPPVNILLKLEYAYVRDFKIYLSKNI